MKLAATIATLLCLAVVHVPWGTTLLAQAPFEAPPVLKAKDLAPKALLSGPGYRVADNVPTTGLLGEFRLEADAGSFDVRGVDLLRIRIAELPAIQQLDRTSKTAEFAKSAGRAAARPVESTVNMLSNPVDTVTGAPAGVGRFFERVKAGGESITKESAAPAAAGRIGSVTINALGFEEERRRLAKKLSVDPYTTNPVLGKKLTEVAWVTFSARQAINITSAAVVPYAMGMSTVSLTNNLVWDVKPADLIAMNAKKLKTMGASDAQAGALIDNPYYSISLLTSFVSALERLDGVAGRPEAIALAATTVGEDQARFLAGCLQMLAHHHQWVTPLAEVMARVTVVGKTAAGGLVVGAPVDYVAWTERVANFARRSDFTASSLDLWLTGRMSPQARQEFERIGWRVHEGSPTATAN